MKNVLNTTCNFCHKHLELAINKRVAECCNVRYVYRPLGMTERQVARAVRHALKRLQAGKVKVDAPLSV